MPFSKQAVRLRHSDKQIQEACQPVEMSAPISLQDQAFTLDHDEQYNQFFCEDGFSGRDSSPPIN